MDEQSKNEMVEQSLISKVLVLSHLGSLTKHLESKLCSTISFLLCSSISF